MMGRTAAGTVSLVLLGACGQPGAAPAPIYEIVGDSIPAPLNGVVGGAVSGQDLFVERARGHCVLCHQIDGLDAPFQGNVGPNLTAVGGRLTPGQIRLRIVDYSQINPNTVMPPYYRTTGLNQVAAEHRGKPVLKEQEIEDLVAYLKGLKG